MIPSDHARRLCLHLEADEATVVRAIGGALAAKVGWEALQWGDRAAILVKVATLITKKYQYKRLATTILTGNVVV